MAGLTTDGFTGKTQAEIIADTNSEQRATISPTWDPDPDQPTGQINGINARSQAFLWELIEDVYHSLNRDSAEGEQLDNIGKLVGVPRLAKANSEVTLSCDLDPTVTLTAGETFAENADIPGQLWTPKDTFVSDGAGGLYDVRFVSLTDGAIEATAGAISIINTPVTGWNSCTNPVSAAVGSLQESDSEYRLRQELSLGRAGSTNPDAIQAALLAVSGVSSANVVENDTMNTVDGIPPKAFEAIVADGDPSLADSNEIAQAIWDTKAAGIETHGDETGTAYDSENTERVISFTRVTELELYVDADVAVALDYPGDQALADAIGAVVLSVGQDVTPSQITGAIFRDVPGVRDVTEVRIGTTPSPVYTPRFVVAGNQRGNLDSSRTVANSTPWVDN